MKIEKLSYLKLMEEKEARDCGVIDTNSIEENLVKKINELIDAYNLLKSLDENKIISMIEHKADILVATSYKVFRKVGDEFIELKFVREE